MAIQINYSDSTGTHKGLDVLRTEGLKAYFDHYESTFTAAQVDPLTVTQAGQAFSTNNSSAVTGVTVNPISSAFADQQYGGNTNLSSGDGSAFIAEVKSGSGLVVGQLAYTLFNAPSHTLGGELDTIYLGDQATLNSAALSGLHDMTEPVVDISNLASVLNGGIKETSPGVWEFIGRNEGLSGGVNTDTNSIWYGTEYGNNDTHNIVYDLMSNHGLVAGAKETASLQHVLNKFDLDHNGTVNDEVFDGFAGKDTFKVGGGYDTIQGFDITQDVLQVTTGYGHSSAADVLAASFDGTYNGKAGVYVFDDLFGISHFSFLVGVSASDLSASNVAIG